MSASTWILIIWMSGWGNGFGSAGNTLTTAEFSSKERCEFALKHYLNARDRGIGGLCAQK